MLRDESIDVPSNCNWNDHADAHGVRCDQVHHRLKRIVKARGSLDAQEAAALREAQELRLWRRYGHNSLLDYMEREMGYTPRAVQDRTSLTLHCGLG